MGKRPAYEGHEETASALQVLPRCGYAGEAISVAPSDVHTRIAGWVVYEVSKGLCAQHFFFFLKFVL